LTFFLIALSAKACLRQALEKSGLGHKPTVASDSFGDDQLNGAAAEYNKKYVENLHFSSEKRTVLRARWARVVSAHVPFNLGALSARPR
jgi:hypothetical protein